MPLDDFGEGPNDRAYRHFLLSAVWRAGLKEVRVLFDPENLASILFPRPRALREVIDASQRRRHESSLGALGTRRPSVGSINSSSQKRRDAAFDPEVIQGKEEIPEIRYSTAATQVFTPRWIVRFLVQNKVWDAFGVSDAPGQQTC